MKDLLKGSLTLSIIDFGAIRLRFPGRGEGSEASEHSDTER